MNATELTDGSILSWLPLPARWRRRVLIRAYDSVAMLVALWLAFCMRFGEFYSPASASVLGLALAAVVAGGAALSVLGVYRIITRYLDLQAASLLAYGAAATAASWSVLVHVSGIAGMPRSVTFIYFGVLFLFLFFGRVTAAHLLFGARSAAPIVPKAKQCRQLGVAIYGANVAGFNIARSIGRNRNDQLRFFIDADPSLIGRRILGVTVRAPDALIAAVEACEVDQVFLARPFDTRSERIAMISEMAELGIKVMTVPSPAEIVSGRYTVSDTRKVNINDLLARDIRPPLPHLIEGGVRDKVILVTGAGGSIGSEICRQILLYEPRRLILFDHSEYALYLVHSELSVTVSERTQRAEILPVIGSLLNEALVRETIARYAPDVVFHAAAYKHVPLLEENVVVGVENNVIGTAILADACAAAGVSRFTMISTDKAVRPTNVMGASKRVAELYIQAMANVPGVQTCFGIVRFGNVLGSSGSVVERFRQQIADGGPITVTDPEITRFFMSIPEATQLVLQANLLATSGDVFVLDMGEAVGILDLARTMIALSGMTERTAERPTGDIAIQFVGLRPGEKLHEELFIGTEISDTAHPEIKRARERYTPMSELQTIFADLRKALQARDDRAVRRTLAIALFEDRALAALAAGKSV